MLLFATAKGQASKSRRARVRLVKRRTERWSVGPRGGRNERGSRDGCGGEGARDGACLIRREPPAILPERGYGEDDCATAIDGDKQFAGACSQSCPPRGPEEGGLARVWRGSSRDGCAGQASHETALETAVKDDPLSLLAPSASTPGGVTRDKKQKKNKKRGRRWDAGSLVQPVDSFSYRGQDGGGCCCLGLREKGVAGSGTQPVQMFIVEAERVGWITRQRMEQAPLSSRLGRE
jgi:hypothetical protein